MLQPFNGVLPRMDYKVGSAVESELYTGTKLSLTRHRYIDIGSYRGIGCLK